MQNVAHYWTEMNPIEFLKMRSPDVAISLSFSCYDINDRVVFIYLVIWFVYTDKDDEVPAE